MGLLEKIISCDLSKALAVDGALNLFDKIERKQVEKFEGKMLKGMIPDFFHIWMTWDRDNHSFVGHEAIINYHDPDAKILYRLFISQSDNCFRGTIKDANNNELWRIYERKEKRGLLRKSKIVAASDIDVYQGNNCLGTIKTLNEPDSKELLWIDFLKWSVEYKGNTFVIKSDDSHVIAKITFKTLSVTFAFIEFESKSQESLMVLINSVVLINQFARSREERARYIENTKKEYKQFKKESRKYGGDW